MTNNILTLALVAAGTVMAAPAFAALAGVSYAETGDGGSHPHARDGATISGAVTEWGDTIYPADSCPPGNPGLGQGGPRQHGVAGDPKQMWNGLGANDPNRLEAKE